jgi:hypothetical protein
MIRDGYPGSGYRILIFYPFLIPDPGDKKAPDPGSRSATLANRHILTRHRVPKREEKWYISICDTISTLILQVGITVCSSGSDNIGLRAHLWLSQNQI